MLSVLVVNWNTKAMLERCLRSLQEHPAKEESEVIVVDNASSDGSAQMVRDSFPAVRLNEPGSNTGYARGNNLAFESARGEWLLTLNPDTEVPEGALQVAIERLAAHDDAGCLALRLVGPDGQPQASVRGFPSVLGILGDLLGLARAFPGSVWDSYRMHGFDYSIERYAPQPMGTFLLFRRSALESIGNPRRPFDESFPIFFNEVDLLFRLRQAGWGCVYSPAAHVLHHGGMSTRQVRKSMIWESHRSLVRYLAKHAATAFERAVLPVVELIVLVAALVRARGYDVGFRPNR